MTRFKHYTWVLLGGVLAPVLFVLGFNLLLAKQNGHSDRFLRASEWQEKTHGITIAQILGRDPGPFKILRLNDRLPDINTIVFGSSTAMAIQGDMFPPPIRSYNFSHSANPLTTIIGEAEYILDHHENVRWMFVPLDWSIGFLFFPGEPTANDLSRAHVLQEITAADEKLSWVMAIKEALTYPKIMNLYGIFRAIVTSDDKIGGFRSAFLQRNGDDYVCLDSVARDYEPDGRGSCFGYRYDGSMYIPVSGNARFIMKDALRGNSFVRKVLQMTKGQPSEVFLSRLAEQAHRLEHRGGRMIFFMPPVFPGLEAAVLKLPDISAYLQRTKAVVSRWAEDNKLVLLDFGPSENFGCIASEFVDGPHTSPACYRKAFGATWRMHPDILRLPAKVSAQ